MCLYNLQYTQYDESRKLSDVNINLKKHTSTSQMDTLLMSMPLVLDQRDVFHSQRLNFDEPWISSPFTIAGDRREKEKPRLNKGID